MRRTRGPCPLAGRWQTFGHLYSAADLAAFKAEKTPSAMAAKISDPARSAAWLVCAADAASPEAAVVAGPGCAPGFVGMALVQSPSTLPHDAVTPSSWELLHLYLSKAVQGQGLGTELAKHAIEVR